MTVNGSSAYADLLPTQEELDALGQVLDEVLAEELAGELPDGDYGPWDNATQPKLIMLRVWGCGG